MLPHDHSGQTWKRQLAFGIAWLRRPPSRQLRVKLFVTGCLLPSCCLILLGLGFDASPFGMWQSGEFKVLAWKLAVEFMLAEYAKLPTQPPDCYVCTAAATGHAAWVKAESLTIEGRVVRVNQQMRRLKLLEFMLLASAPGMHKKLRRIYDRCGPRCAALCRRSVWFADASYLLLIPPAWIAERLRRLAHVSPQKVDQLWR